MDAFIIFLWVWVFKKEIKAFLSDCIADGISKAKERDA